MSAGNAQPHATLAQQFIGTSSMRALKVIAFSGSSNSLRAYQPSRSLHRCHRLDSLGDEKLNSILVACLKPILNVAK